MIVANRSNWCWCDIYWYHTGQLLCTRWGYVWIRSAKGRPARRLGVGIRKFSPGVGPIYLHVSFQVFLLSHGRPSQQPAAELFRMFSILKIWSPTEILMENVCWRPWLPSESTGAQFVHCASRASIDWTAQFRFLWGFSSNAKNSFFGQWLGPFNGAIAVPSVTRCRCRGHRCAGGARQYRLWHLVNGREAARSGEWAQHFSNASCLIKSGVLSNQLMLRLHRLEYCCGLLYLLYDKLTKLDMKSVTIFRAVGNGYSANIRHG